MVLVPRRVVTIVGTRISRMTTFGMVPSSVFVKNVRVANVPLLKFSSMILVMF